MKLLTKAEEMYHGPGTIVASSLLLEATQASEGWPTYLFNTYILLGLTWTSKESSKPNENIFPTIPLFQGAAETSDKSPQDPY